jgi:hypothetical protein
VEGRRRSASAQQTPPPPRALNQPGACAHAACLGRRPVWTRDVAQAVARGDTKKRGTYERHAVDLDDVAKVDERALACKRKRKQVSKWAGMAAKAYEREWRSPLRNSAKGRGGVHVVSERLRRGNRKGSLAHRSAS